MIPINDDEFTLLKNYLLENTGIEVPEEKKYLFETRLFHILENEKFSNFTEFYNSLKTDKDARLHNILLESMTTNETSFFRDIHPYDTLFNDILPQIAEEKKQNAIFFPPQISIWSAGCSSGQEPYSIAMTSNEWINKSDHYKNMQVTITATDISQKVLDKAKKGIYTQSDIKGMKKEYVDTYFHETDSGYIINDIIKKMINFKILNLSDNFSFNLLKPDIIFCRNVIIYFSDDIKTNIIKKMYNMLNPKGILILGASETIYQLSDKFDSKYYKDTIYYKARK